MVVLNSVTWISSWMAVIRRIGQVLETLVTSRRVFRRRICFILKILSICGVVKIDILYSCKKEAKRQDSVEFHKEEVVYMKLGIL